MSRAGQRRGAAGSGKSAGTVRKTVLAAMLGVVSVCALGGCGSARTTGATNSNTLIQVVAAQSVWGSIAAQLGGSEVRVTSVTAGSAADQRDFAPSAADLTAISGAQLFILNGAGYDPWADQAAAAHPGIGRLEVDAGDQVGVEPGGDPYLWEDPGYLATVARQITTDYIRLRPAQTTYFQQQEQSFESGPLAAAGALIGRIKASFHGTPVGASDPVAVPLAAQLGLTLSTPSGLLADGGAGSASAAQDRTAEAQIRAGQIKLFLYDTQDHSAAARAQLSAAEAAGVPVAAISEIPDPAGESVQQWLTGQFQNIRSALAGGNGD